MALREERHGRAAVAVMSVATSRVVTTLLPSPWHGLHVENLAVDGSGQVWVTLVRGPICGGDVAGCAPQPRTCANEVLRIDPATGARHVELTTGDEQSLGEATPSPDGDLLAYLDGGCASSSDNQYLRIRDLRTGRSWTIGRSLPVCHVLTNLAWDGPSTLLAAYGPSAVRHPEPWFGHGLCLGSRPQTLAVIPAGRGAQGLPGPHLRGQQHCQIYAAAPVETGVAAIEGCGPPSPVAGPARLLTYSPAGTITAQSPLGRCASGNATLSGSAGEALGVAPELCPSPGIPHPDLVLFVDSGGRVRVVARIRTELGMVSDVAW